MSHAGTIVLDSYNMCKHYPKPTTMIRYSNILLSSLHVARP
jgi:hypothetical protein